MEEEEGLAYAVKEESKKQRGRRVSVRGKGRKQKTTTTHAITAALEAIYSAADAKTACTEARDEADAPVVAIKGIAFNNRFLPPSVAVSIAEVGRPRPQNKGVWADIL